MQYVDHRQDEACRLARAGLRNSDQVAAHEDGRYRGALDRSRVVIAAVRNSAEQFF
jgi:hypothetical protein